MQFRVRDIDAYAGPRAFGKGDEIFFHFSSVWAGGGGKPALRVKILGVGEGVRVLMVDVGAGRDYDLWGVRGVLSVMIHYQGQGKWERERVRECTPGGIFWPQMTAPEGGTTRGRDPGPP